MDTKKEKSLKINNFKKYMTSIILTTGLTGMAIACVDSKIDHTKDICPLTNFLGIEHQVDEINNDINNRQNKIYAYSTLRSILINSYSNYELTKDTAVIIEQYNENAIIPENNRQVIKILRLNK